MWRRARKWVQWIRALITILFFNFSWSPICWSCWTIDPSWSVLAAATYASHDWMWMSLFAWVLIFSIAFFQFLKGFEIHVPPVLWREIPLFLQTLQKVLWKFSSNVSEVKLSSHFLYFWLLVIGQYLLLHFSWTVNRFFAGLGSKHSVSDWFLLTSSSLLLEASVDFEELAPPKKERISIVRRDQTIAMTAWPWPLNKSMKFKIRALT